MKVFMRSLYVVLAIWSALGPVCVLAQSLSPDSKTVVDAEAKSGGHVHARELLLYG
jgi:hypothetical protein